MTTPGDKTAFLRIHKAGSLIGSGAQLICKPDRVATGSVAYILFHEVAYD